MSVKISPPVRNVSRPTVLAPLQRTCLTIRHSPAKKTTDPVAPLKKAWSRVDGSYAVVLAPRSSRPVTRLMKVVPHERIHKHKMSSKVDDEAILYYYYHAETRRKCKTNFEGVVLLLRSTGLPVSCKISILILLNVRFSTGR